MSDTELEALETWIQKVTKIQFKQKRFLDNLRDGVVLCVLVSKIKGKKVMYNRNPRGLDFMEKENITTFIQECSKLGVKIVKWNDDDLRNGKKERHILNTLFSLAELAKEKDDYKGPLLEFRTVDHVEDDGVIEKRDSFKDKRQSNSSRKSSSSVNSVDWNEEKKKLMEWKQKEMEKLRQYIQDEKTKMESDLVQQRLKSLEDIGKEKVAQMQVINTELEEYRKKQMENIEKELQKKAEENAMKKLKDSIALKEKRLKEMEQKLINVHEKHQKELDDLKKKKDQEMKDIKGKSEKEIQDLKSQLSDLKTKYEKQIQELKQQLENAETKHDSDEELVPEEDDDSPEDKVKVLHLFDKDGKPQIYESVEYDKHGNRVPTSVDAQVEELKAQLEKERMASRTKDELIEQKNLIIQQLQIEQLSVDRKDHRMIQLEDQVSKLEKKLQEYKQLIEKLRNEKSETSQLLEQQLQEMAEREKQEKQKMIEQHEAEKEKILQEIKKREEEEKEKAMKAEQERQKREEERKEQLQKQKELEEKLLQLQSQLESNKSKSFSEEQKRQSIMYMQSLKALADKEREGYENTIAKLKDEIFVLKETRKQLLRLVDNQVAEKELLARSSSGVALWSGLVKNLIPKRRDTFTFHNSPVTTPSTPHSAKSKPDKQPEKKPEKKPQEPPPQPQNSKTKMFGVDIAEVMKREHETEDMPKLLKQMFEFLEPKAATLEGIFRVGESMIQLKKYKAQIDNGETLDFQKMKTPHYAANLFKAYLRELPKPILPFELYHAFLEAGALQDKEKRVEKFKSLIEKLPPLNAKVFKAILSLLHKISINSATNKMTAQNLAVVFGLNVLRKEVMETADLMKECPKINATFQVLIELYPQLYPS